MAKKCNMVAKKIYYTIKYIADKHIVNLILLESVYILLIFLNDILSLLTFTCPPPMMCQVYIFTFVFCSSPGTKHNINCLKKYYVS